MTNRKSTLGEELKQIASTSMPTNTPISQILGLQFTGMKYHIQFICFILPTELYTWQKIWLFDSSGRS